MKRSLLLLAMLSGLVTPAYASVSSAGTVNNVLAIREGKLFFNQSGTHDQRPACATADRWVVDMSTPGGQIIAATVLTAYAQNRTVGVAGTGSCADWGDTESVENILVY